MKKAIENKINELASQERTPEVNDKIYLLFDILEDGKAAEEEKIKQLEEILVFVKQQTERVAELERQMKRIPSWGPLT